MAVSEPDKGYAWVIVACCAYVQFAMFGVFRSAGLLYVAILQNFGVSREEASWPFSMCSAMFDLAGILVSILSRFMSVRKISLIGSSIATLGLALCYIAESMMWINICFGFIYGTGVGLVTVLTPVIIDQYFKHHKTTALGISFSGVSVSSFVFPPMMEFLIRTYGLPGLFLILSGVVMNTLVVSSLLKKPPWKVNQDSSKKAKTVKFTNLSTLVDIEKSKNGINCFDDNVHESFIPHDSDRMDEVNHTRIISKPIPPTSCHSTEGDVSRSRINREKILPIRTAIKSSVKETITTRISNRDSDTDDETLQPLYTEKQKPNICRTDVKAEINDSKKQSLIKDMKELFSSPIFYSVALTCGIYYLLFISFLVVINDYAIDEGVDESSSIYVLATFSLIDMFGRCGLGWLTDRKFIKSKNMFILSSVAIGIMFQLYPFAVNLWQFSIIGAVHGLFNGSCITLLYILQAEFCGSDKLSLTVGLVHFTNGIISFSRPSLIGVFRDVIGSYDWMFRLFSLLSFLSALLWVAEPWLNRRARTSDNSS